MSRLLLSLCCYSWKIGHPSWSLTMTLKLIKNRLKLLEAPAISPLASRENWQWKENFYHSPTNSSIKRAKRRVVHSFLLVMWYSPSDEFWGIKREYPYHQRVRNCYWSTWELYHMTLLYIYLFMRNSSSTRYIYILYISMPFVLLIAVEHKYVGPIIHVHSQNII